MEYMTGLRHVLTSGVEEYNSRTMLKTRRLFGLSIEYGIDGKVFSTRVFSPKIAAAEIAWMVSGQKSTEIVSRHTNIWKKFEDSPGTIETAYGYRWRTLFGRDQLAEGRKLLSSDPSSRQCLVLSWDPANDGLSSQGKTKNVPCPFAFSFFVLEGIGKMVVYQRSADMVVGVPYDILSYFILGRAFFNSIGNDFGGISIMIGDAHIYENFYAIAEKMCLYDNPPGTVDLMHKWNIESIVSNPDSFVNLFKNSTANIKFAINEKLEATK